jgi:hypothetical protein
MYNGVVLVFIVYVYISASGPMANSQVPGTIGTLIAKLVFIS